MSYWNHRVVKKTYPSKETLFSVREVYYNDDDTIYAYTENPANLECESIEALKEYLLWCLKSLDKPILIDGEVKFVDYNNDEIAIS
jgi:hypothetical protein